jgi:restriction endonuclease Mrr
MVIKTFKNYCEAQDATAGFVPNANSGFMNQQNKSFEQVVDPIVDDFAQKILTNVLSQDVVQLQPAQIEYILNSLKAKLSNMHYDPQKDLGKSINDLFRKGNQPSTPRNRSMDTLPDKINNLFKK